jgi:hypothetical protein
LVIINNAALNMGVQVAESLFLFLFGEYLGLEFLGLVVIFSLTF